MKKLVLSLVAAATLLAGCAGRTDLGGITPAKAAEAVDIVADRYERVRPWAVMLAPALPADVRARVERFIAVADKALAAARAATTVAAQLEALKKANTAVGELESDVGPAPS